MMPRDRCFKALAAVRGDAIVVSRYSAAFEWGAVAPHPLNYFAIGAMGQCSSFALGLALGLPQHKIIVLDGDGSLLMNLGSLVTIAAAGPKNLVHFVCENGNYEVNGGHPIPGQGRVSFAEIARGAGYPEVFEFDDLATFAENVPALLTLAGPVFGTLKLAKAGELEIAFNETGDADMRRRFKEVLVPLIRGRDGR
jgi:sulfopyruvate decarboxylase subunit beta